MADVPDHYPFTPDGRYFVVRARLWRRSNPALPEAERAALVHALMNARREVGRARAGLRPEDGSEHAVRGVVRRAGARRLKHLPPPWPGP